jgi:hypothetical protein
MMKTALVIDDEGTRFVVIQLDDGTGEQIDICLNVPTFVSFADHLSMLADEVMKPGPWQDLESAQG